jgi:hypothetical protein
MKKMASGVQCLQGWESGCKGKIKWMKRVGAKEQIEKSGACRSIFKGIGEWYAKSFVHPQRMRD